MKVCANQFWEAPGARIAELVESHADRQQVEVIGDAVVIGVAGIHQLSGKQARQEEQ